MKRAIIVHGKPNRDKYYNNTVGSPSNLHWLPWLQAQLIMRNILAQTPEMPRPYEPDYAAWLEVFEQFAVDNQTILVGHSCGGGFLVRWLSQNNIRVGHVVLVAPSLGLDWDERDFFDFEIDPALVAKTSGLTIFVADNDRDGIKNSAAKIAAEAGSVKVRRFKTGGHFTFKDMQTVEFPELLKEALA